MGVKQVSVPPLLSFPLLPAGGARTLLDLALLVLGEERGRAGPPAELVELPLLDVRDERALEGPDAVACCCRWGMEGCVCMLPIQQAASKV